MRKKLMLAIVDKESDIIFCEACEADGATARALHQLRLGLQKHLIVLQTEEGLPSRIRFEVIDDLDAPKKIVVAKIWKNACCNKPGCVTCSQLESGHGPYCDALAPLYHVEGIGLASGMHVAEGRGVVEPLKPPPGHCDRPAILEG